MQRLSNRPHDTEELPDTTLITRPTSSSYVARVEALSETTLSKQQKTIEDSSRSRGPGHTYDGTIARDNARVQYGDTYNVSYHRGGEPEGKQDAWPQAMTMLRFPQMNLRRQTVRDVHTGTCEWIFEEPEYKSWCDREQTPLHHGILWIKSKPGAGKSTLMKFLLDSKEQRPAPDNAVISFFFNARGDTLERSLEGLYRQLLHQILTKVARLQSVISASEIFDLASLGWPRQPLENSFKRCVLRLKEERVTCFIDALDECPESDIRDLVEIFEDLGETTAAKGIGFRVCFSSRHYPNVSLGHCQHFVLDGQSGHQHDIATYIDSKLRLRKSKIIEGIKTAVLERAQGVFLWVVLVIKKLVREVDRGNIHDLRSRLDEVPDGLDAVFRDTLKLTGNHDDMLIQMLQWVMFAPGRLTREELYFGVHTGMASDGHLEPWDRDEITSDVMELFITSCSRGLVESVGGLRPRVQFIHESVRDHLFGGGLELLVPDIKGSLEGASHDYLKGTCIKLFTPSTMSHIPPPVPSLESSHEPARRNAGHGLERLFPLLSYALYNVFHHAKLAADHGVAQDEFFTSFPLNIWNQIRIGWGHTPAISKTQVFVNAGFLELHPDYHPLTSAELKPAEHKSATRYAVDYADDETLERVIAQVVLASICDDDQASVIEHAVIERKSHALELLFRGRFHLSTDESFREMLSQALLVRDATIATTLLNHEAHMGPFTADALHNAINTGSLASVKALLDSGADINAPTMQASTASSKPCPEHQTSRQESSQDGICDDEMVENDGSPAIFQDNDIAEHLTAFEYAALIGRKDIVAYLLALNPHHSHAPSEHYEFARHFYLAALLGHHTVVERFVGHPSWLTSLDTTTVWQQSLSAAAENGHTETVKVLLADRAEMQAQGLLPAYYEAALREAVFTGRPAILRVLLDFVECSPHFDTQGQRTLSDALQWATSRGYEECARMLRKRGVSDVVYG